MEENTRDGRIRMMRKYVVRCVQAVTGEKIFLVQFQDVQDSKMSYCLILYVCSKEEVGQEVDETISDLPPKVQG